MNEKILTGLKRLLVLAALAANAQAAPIVFSGARYETTAFAVSGALSDASADVSPSSALPLISAATVVPANDFATSFAIATAGLLSASAEADSFAGAAGANAGAQARFVGNIVGTGALTLRLIFDNLTSLIGDASADATLFVLLTNTLGATTTTLFDNFYTAGKDITLQFNAVGGLSTLDLLLFSEAATTRGGQSGQNFAQVSVTGTIPLPPTLPLVGVGLAALLAMRRPRGLREFGFAAAPA